MLKNTVQTLITKTMTTELAMYEYSNSFQSIQANTTHSCSSFYYSLTRARKHVCLYCLHIAVYTCAKGRPVNHLQQVCGLLAIETTGQGIESHKKKNAIHHKTTRKILLHLENLSVLITVLWQLLTIKRILHHNKG